MIFGIRALRRGGGAALVGGTALCGGMALAQGGAPRTIPGLDNFSLPASRPTPNSTPSATPTPDLGPAPEARRTPVPPPPAARSTPVARQAPQPTSTPVARPTPAPHPTGAAAPSTPVPIPTATPPRPLPASQPTAEPVPSATPPLEPLPVPLPSPTPAPIIAWERVDPVAALALAVAAVFASIFGLGYWWRNRPVRERVERRGDKRHEVFALGTDERAALPPASQPRPVPDPNVRPRIAIDLIPRRAGTNLLSAAVEYQVIVTNRGTLTAHDIRLDIRLLSAGAGQDAEIATLFAQTIAHPITEPFPLPADSRLTLDGMVMHPRETLALLDVPGDLFVPVLAINLRYAWAGGAVGQVARSFVVGIDRGGERLQPFRRDVARMYETVAALPYSVSVDA